MSLLNRLGWIQPTKFKILYHLALVYPNKLSCLEISKLINRNRAYTHVVLKTLVKEGLVKEYGEHYDIKYRVNIHLLMYEFILDYLTWRGRRIRFWR